jgi:hypothetical protein
MTTRESADAPQAFSHDMALSGGDGDDDRKRTERKGAIYELDETKGIAVADGYVTFTRSFCYLGSMVSYNLCDNEDITA